MRISIGNRYRDRSGSWWRVVSVHEAKLTGEWFLAKNEDDNKRENWYRRDGRWSDGAQTSVDLCDAPEMKVPVHI